MTNLPERFWAKVEKTETCWLWTAVKDKGGYGQFKWDGGMRRVHRLAYIDLIGPIPTGLSLDHLCRVTSCLNPDHLEPVTHRENVIRGIRPATTRNVDTCRNGLHPWPDSSGWRGGRLLCVPCLKASARRNHEARKRRRALAAPSP